MLVSKHNQTEKSVVLDEKLQRRFDWSLKPLIELMKFVGGINLQTSTASKSSNVAKNILFTALASFVIVSNIAVNGSRIDTRYQYWEADEAEFDSSWANFFWDPQILLKLTLSCSVVAFFSFLPAIHFVFFIIILLSPRWRELLETLQDINCRMKLTESFYRKCRRLCNFLILILVLVNRI